jgi:hypothetical protein
MIGTWFCLHMVFSFTKKSMILKTNAVRCIRRYQYISDHVILLYGLVGFLSSQQYWKNPYTYVPVAFFDLRHQKEPTTCATPRATCKKVKNTTSVANLYLSAFNQSSDCGSRDWVDRSRRPKYKDNTIRRKKGRIELTGTSKTAAYLSYREKVPKCSTASTPEGASPAP